MKLFSGKINDLASFYRAFLNTRREMGISMLILVVITLSLSIVFYLVEHNEQPDVFDGWWSCVVWAYSRYIEGGDGVFEGGPVTIIGRTIAFMLGLIGIAIVAIPAGLIGSGFMDAIAEEKREKELAEYRNRMHKMFRRVQSKCTQFREVPIFKSIVEIQAKMEMDTKDIIDVAEKFPEFRLANLATTQTVEERPQDRLVVQMSPLTDGAPYGCCINRNSRITIVCPTASNEVGLGYFSYYLALYGGFNYVSKEIKCDRDDNFSYYNIDSDREDANIGKFIEDIKSLSTGEGKWVIYIIAAEGHKELIHFVDGPKKGCNDINDSKVTILDRDKTIYLALVDGVSNLLASNYDAPIETSRQKYYGAASAKHISRHVGTETCSQFSIRIDYKVAVWNNNASGIIYNMANEIRKHLLGEDCLPEDAVKQWKSFGYGY